LTPGLPINNPPSIPDIAYGAQTLKSTKPQSVENQTSKLDKIFERLTHLESYVIPQSIARLSNVEAGLSRFENQYRSTANVNIQVEENELFCSQLTLRFKLMLTFEVKNEVAKHFVTVFVCNKIKEKNIATDCVTDFD